MQPGKPVAVLLIAGAVAVSLVGPLPVTALGATSPAAPAGTALVQVDVTRDRHRIDPRVYGVAFASPAQLRDLNAPLNRSGGNATSRYNWKLNAFNTASDWYYESLGYTSAEPGREVDSFIARNSGAGAGSMITIPMIGYVARLGPGRSRLASFSVAKYGPQRDTDWQWFPDAGDGISANGSVIAGNDPRDANVPAGPAFQEAWVRHIVATAGPSTLTAPRYYLYDNEASIWQQTHRDVHPTGARMGEYLAKVIAYGSRIRAADPKALLLGPEEWGWDGFRYSGYDQHWGAAHGWSSYPDRAAHGYVDYFPWLLRQLRDHDRATGQRLLDVATAHWYPQGGEFSGDVSRATQLRRNRSTRSLWDPNYVDESWIAQPVRLIPRLKQWVAANYPGTKVGLTEYNWGAEGHMSGALAQADVLGILGWQGADLANRWTTPPTGSPAYLAMKLYRNYDGRRSAFGGTSVRALVADRDWLSAFAAQRPDGSVTIMLLNKNPDAARMVDLAVAGVSGPRSAQVWRLAAGAIRRQADTTLAAGRIALTVPAQSVTLVVIPG